MNDKKDSKDIQKNEDTQPSNEKDERECCVYVDACGCYVEPCCCSSVYVAPAYSCCC